MVNTLDSNQMLHSAASDLGVHCLQSLSVTILRVITVTSYHTCPKRLTNLFDYLLICLKIAR